MALIPLLWVGWHQETRREWWWVAVVFGISWLADSASHWTAPATVSAVYPVSQAALLTAVLVQRDWAGAYLFALTALALLVVMANLPSLLLRTTAWGSVSLLAVRQPGLGRLRIVLLVAFGGGLLAWIGYCWHPAWLTWGLYQGVRALSIGLFCWASQRPALRVA